MIPNRLRDLWSEGRPAVNGWCSIASPFAAEIMAAQGFDAITIDMQHGALDYADLLAMFQAMRASGAALMARVPWNDPGIIMKALDAGAIGIICPMINTAEEAAHFAAAMRYPPRGIRSFGPTRAAFALGSDYARHANDTVLAIAMIETAEAMANLDAITATPGLDGIYVGPADLTLSLSEGRLPPGLDREEPEMIAAIRRILVACKANGLRAGIHCGTSDYAARVIEWGFDFATVGNDVRFLSAAAGGAVARFRELTGGEAASQAAAY